MDSSVFLPSESFLPFFKNTARDHHEINCLGRLTWGPQPDLVITEHMYLDYT